MFLRVSFAPLVHTSLVPTGSTAADGPQPASGLVLLPPRWGVDGPLCFPPAYRYVVAVLSRACAVTDGSCGNTAGDVDVGGTSSADASAILPASHPARLPWELWEAHILPQLPFDGFP